MALVVQVVRGLLLVLNFTTLEAFNSVAFVIVEVHYGWLFKLLHRNNARVLFLALYLHLFKNISMVRYRLVGV